VSFMASDLRLYHDVRLDVRPFMASDLGIDDDDDVTSDLTSDLRPTFVRLFSGRFWPLTCGDTK